MELTDKQFQGVKIIKDRYKAKEKYTIISGFAGTGKTTLVKYAIEELRDFGIDPKKDVVYVSYTGKAAQVLKSKGNPNVMTLHKLLFKSTLLPNGRYSRTRVLAIPYKIIVVDEISMVPASMMQILFSYGKYIIGLGDEFQLPPIEKKEDNGLLYTPHVRLTEIMRQEAESEIIQLTMKIREKEPIQYFDGSEVKVMSRNSLALSMVQWADQTICATNATRHSINTSMRQAAGRSGDPQDGDKIICNTNYWNEEERSGAPLVNGTIGILQNPCQSFYRVPPRFGNEGTIDLTIGTLLAEDGTEFNNIAMDTKKFTDNEFSLSSRTIFNLKKNKKTEHNVPYDFSYAYAITCHRSQGSEWKNVLVIEEGFPFSADEHARWLYTACTRASNKLVLLR